jgi:hypothetical protein
MAGAAMAVEAGLAVLDRKVTLELVADPDRLGTILEETRRGAVGAGSPPPPRQR